MWSSLFALALIGPAPAPSLAQNVAVKAGTVYTVEGPAHENGVVLVRDGRIVAVGADLVLPPGTEVLDYGPDAVVIPGLVAADSTFGASRAAARTAEPSLRAIDAFDPYTTYVWALRGGVTSAYLAPARGRLIAGQGAVVKLAGGSRRARVLNESAALHGAVSAEARRTPGYWEPPVPATSDVGLGVVQQQLPRSVMGAIVALGELLELARTGAESDEYGPYAGPELAELLRRHLVWRMGAETAPEIRALLEFFTEADLPLIIDGAQGAAELANEIAAAGVGVIVDAPIRPNRPPRDFGKDEDDAWPRFDVAVHLAEAGVRFAIATPNDVSAAELLFAARSASAGGLDADAALRAITLSPAELLGVAGRVGSLAPGKDADMIVLNGPPLAASSSVVATLVDGEVAWETTEAAGGPGVIGGSGGTFVLAVEELYIGDGTVIAPGQVLIQDGRIAAVGRSVSQPGGARIVHGHAAMPGMIDALGFLGLEGSRKVPAPSYQMSRIVEAGDFADRRVAKAGVTTVAMVPRKASAKGAPMLAYKPAGSDPALQVIDDPTALRFKWNDKNRNQSGRSVRDVLDKAVAYVAKWEEYEEAIAKWTPPPAPAEDAEKDDDEDAEKKGDDDKDDDKAKDDDGKKKKKKKKKDEPAKPMTGAWVTHVTLPPFESSRMRLYVLDEDGEVSGSLRCEALTDGLIDMHGTRDEREVELAGDGSRGPITLTAKLVDGDEDEDQPRTLEGTVTLGANEIEFTAEQTSTEYEIARRPERRRPPKAKKTKRVKGEPKKPALDPGLEPLRRALAGEAAVIVEVQRADEILECVEAFEAAGLKPILLGADEATDVVDDLVGRVAGVLLSNEVVRTDPREGTRAVNRHAVLANAGIPIAFHSAAEEGAAELPRVALYAVSQGLGAADAMRAMTSGAADMLAISDRVGRIAVGLDADVLLLDGPPFDPSTSVVKVWVNGEEIR